MSADLGRLEQALGHQFQNRELLDRALTHKSRAYERPAEEEAADNERLEFLGDAILGFTISDYLIRRFPFFPEGKLSKLKARLVSAAHLYEVAQSMGLGEYLLLGRGEEMSGGRNKKALLSDAVEALIAALYLDAGLETACRFITARVIEPYDPLEHIESTGTTDYKSALQESAQSLKLPPPRYTTIAEQGPEHEKVFTVEVRVGKDWISQAQGHSKKSAGQKAAHQVLQQLGDWGR